MKVVVNRCYGGFSISNEAILDLGKVGHYDLDQDRTNLDLINLIEERGSEYVSGPCANLEVFTIPDTATDWEIDDYDGLETVVAVINGKIRRF